EQLADPLPDLVEAARAEDLRHPALRAEDVDRQRQGGALDVLEQQRGPPVPDDARDDLADLQVRVDLGADPPEVALLLQRGEQARQVGIGHASSIPGRAARLATWAASFRSC